ncbi:hypothetical protein IMG5_188430 [Ichthyophthirius multifiliis]|uniref:Transmembrane protein n=1 Tax=Ichthyophthirius multifiliis TaxID=5932 RepID=G0R3Y6_ICHMU|nr:hypothetical protein IMG5_188430 [Ichthyophthirius multifiliis]EGR27817.1 hypothetical protein IMG5_188430 [Ichthyophthirius multifiliis]|eukprot:XP_004027162.1 hypothetical protein IMG5_188430 [Ichthyophthirius multifiliis]
MIIIKAAQNQKSNKILLKLFIEIPKIIMRILIYIKILKLHHPSSQDHIQFYQKYNILYQMQLFLIFLKYQIYTKARIQMMQIVQSQIFHKIYCTNLKNILYLFIVSVSKQQQQTQKKKINLKQTSMQIQNIQNKIHIFNQQRKKKIQEKQS